jgi:protein FrlC
MVGMMFRIGLKTNVYIDHPIDEVIRKTAVMGYEGIELARTHLMNYTESEVENVKKLLKEHGLIVYSVQAGIPYTDVEAGKKRIELARRLDSPLVNLGYGLYYKPGENFSVAWEKTIQALGELHDYAKKYGIQAAVEPEVRALLSPYIPVLSKYEYFGEVVKRLPDLGLILDVEHAIASLENPYYIIRKYRNHLKLLHISDTIDQLHLHLVPGKGQIDYKTLFRVLKEVNYNGFLSVEIPPYFNNPDQAAYESIMFLNKILMEFF